MARYPSASWHPSPNHGGAMRSHRFALIHGTYGSWPGCTSWLSNPKAGASAHFVVAKSGHVDQLVDTDTQAWHAIAANPVAVGIEFETVHGEALTDAQVSAGAALLAWLHRVHGIPLVVCDDPVAGSGVAYHGLGAAHGLHWGHPACPGAAILAQRPAMVAAAVKAAGSPDATTVSASRGWDGVSFPGPAAFGPGKSGPWVTLLGRRLVAHGFGRFYKAGPGPVWTAGADGAATAAFQRAQGWSGPAADGVPGAVTWARLMAAPRRPVSKPKAAAAAVAVAVTAGAGAAATHAPSAAPVAPSRVPAGTQQAPTTTPTAAPSRVPAATPTGTRHVTPTAAQTVTVTARPGQVVVVTVAP